MQGLWLISILLFSTFSEARRARQVKKQGNPARRIRTNLYSRMKNDLAGVEKRIHGELTEILDTVTELKDITEDALIDSQEIEEVEPAPERIDNKEKGGFIVCKLK